MAQKRGKPLHRLTDEAMQRLVHSVWPGHVRELPDVLERAAILARGPVVEIDEALDQRLSPQDHPLPAQSLRAMERAHIRRVLADTHGVIEGPRGAARILGLHPNTLRFRLQKLGLRNPQRRPS